ncbi:RidA family protein [Jannaschia sp. 2305UL9-9]|uniref:RidA family protein n=1 Tax=Jannaschia sp. 2305UL9-9 TaxID=3121638 RepID=UPI0035290C0D
MIDHKTALSPAHVAAPFGAYSHGILAGSDGRLLVTSGQLGVAADGQCPAGIGEQARICLATIDAILQEAGATRSCILRLNAYVTKRDDFAAYMAVRDEWLTDVVVKPASTLMIVGGFTRPEFLVEVEAMAWVPA